ncbi:MAG: protein kinase [Fuerstiella sp.]
MRMPSENLMQLLIELQLCEQKDIVRCERIVRRLCHDLPDFDSVWLDALVQQKTLTAWQAGALQSKDPSSIRIDDYLLRDVLGESTWLAESMSTGRLVVLRRIVAADRTEVVRTRLSQIIDRAGEVSSTRPVSLELPGQLISGEDNDLFVVSRFVQGWSVDELLIRGGRIPWPAVAEVGLQVLTALRWLESRQWEHRHVSLKNVRIHPSGEVKLVSPFVHGLLHPSVSFHTGLRLEDVEFVAPELVATGKQAGSQSEVYSAGCLLWQMLTARPVFLTADPVNRLLKAKEKDVPDVRGLVPDCPDWMARLIQNFTRRSPDLRPASMEVALNSWAEHASSGTRAVRRLLKGLPDRSRRQPSRMSRRAMSGQAISGRGWSVVAAGMMIAGFVTYGMHRGLLPIPMRLGDAASESVTASDIGESMSEDLSSGRPLATEFSPDDEIQQDQLTARGFLVMPAPDVAGVVVLQSGSVYEASKVEFPGVLHIEASGDTSAVVMVSPESGWKVEASQVVFTGVQVESIADSSADQSVQPLVDCRCDVLAVRKSAFRAEGRSSGIRWQSLAGVTGVVTLEDSVLTGDGYGLWLAEAASRCELRNLLVTSAGAAVRGDLGSGRSAPEVNISRLTQVGGTSFLDLILKPGHAEDLRLDIRCGESVLAPSSALVRVAGPSGWSPDGIQVSFLLPEHGNPTIIPSGVHPVIRFDRSLNSLVAVPDAQILAESLLIAAPEFQGKAESAGDSLSAYQLINYEGPKLSPRLPGVDVSSLPKILKTDHAAQHNLSSAGR